MAGHRIAQHYRDRDPATARAWLMRSAQGGAPQAMVDLARELQEGRGGPRDLPSARTWLLKAQASGAPEAQALLDKVEAQLADRFSEQGR
jgi:TPR repeat protein